MKRKIYTYYVTMFFMRLSGIQGNFYSFNIEFPLITKSNIKKFKKICINKTMDEVVNCGKTSVMSWSEIK